MFEAQAHPAKVNVNGAYQIYKRKKFNENRNEISNPTQISMFKLIILSFFI